MHDTTFALTVLALFTTADRAAEIEGDLLEQSRTRGWLWFWWQVKLTCVALFFHALRQEPGKLLLYAYAIYELGLKIAWWIMVPLAADLRRGLSLIAPFESVYKVSVAILAFALGMLVTRLAPKHGGQLILLASGMLVGRELFLDGADDIWFICLLLIQALLGALLMKWIELRQVDKEAGFPLSRE